MTTAVGLYPYEGELSWAAMDEDTDEILTVVHLPAECAWLTSLERYTQAVTLLKGQRPDWFALPPDSHTENQQ